MRLLVIDLDDIESVGKVARAIDPAVWEEGAQTALQELLDSDPRAFAAEVTVHTALTEPATCKVVWQGMLQFDGVSRDGLMSDPLRHPSGSSDPDAGSPGG